ncbi:hypothetical protein DB346_08580 [Verrucomicrobia bacterium LW23]|nr:hypothetical protein DB346_08580 [Verrucomicrobia bacterium LW23]
MKRGAMKKRNGHKINLWIPSVWKDIIDQQIDDQDTDLSKFVRGALKEKLQRQGVIPNESPSAATILKHS